MSTVLLILALGAAVARGEVTLEVVDVTASPSPDVSGLPAPACAELAACGGAVVDLEVSGAPKPGALDLSLRYDPAVLSFAFAETTVPESILTAREVGEGEALLSVVATDGLEPGVAIRVHFFVPGAEGDRAPVTIATVKAHDAETLEEIPVKLVSGEVVVENGTLSMQSKVLLVALLGIVGLVTLVSGIRRRRLRGT
jgi:hypothetical protein